MPEKENANILNHKLVPKHEVLSEDEKSKLLSKMNIIVSQLPKIHSVDPIIKEINAKIGDVIKITRLSPTAGETVYYRTVIKALGVEKK